MKTSLTTPVCAFALLAGCSGSPAANYSPPVTSLRGTITSASVSTPADLHVALVWDHIVGSGAQLKSAQEVGVRAVFPVHFQIDVNALPPEAAMNTVPAKDAATAGFDANSFRFALGSVLVYEDSNANGSLDLLPINATTSVDKPLGAAKPWLLYIEGTPPPAAVFSGASLTAGFNLVTEEDTGCVGNEYCPPKMKSLPLATDLEIALSSDPKLSEMLCQYKGSTSGDMQGTGTGGSFVPPPAGWTVTCSTDKRSYSAEKCNQPTLCVSPSCTTMSYELEPSDTVPAGWPCP